MQTESKKIIIESITTTNRGVLAIVPPRLLYQHVPLIVPWYSLTPPQL